MGANFNVAYKRPAYSLLQLQSELNSVWPNRRNDLGFITGYKSASNYTGHNPNNLGIVMAYDIGTYINGQIDEPYGRALADYIREYCNGRIYYLIHDMSPTYPPVPKIASNNTNFEWVNYQGSAAHSNHIHISIMDGYWGSPNFYPPAPKSVYDSTASWGVKKYFTRKIFPVGSNITPIKGNGLDMSISLDDIRDVVRKETRDVVKGYVGDVVDVPARLLSKSSTNKQWMLKNAQSNMWGRISQIQELLATMNDVLNEVAKRAGMTDDELAKVVEDSVTTALENGTVDVDVNISGDVK